MGFLKNLFGNQFGGKHGNSHGYNNQGNHGGFNNGGHHGSYNNYNNDTCGQEQPNNQMTQSANVEKYCSSCGMGLKGDAKFCSQCGNAVAQ